MATEPLVRLVGVGFDLVILRAPDAVAAVLVDALNGQDGPDRRDGPHGKAEEYGTPTDTRGTFWAAEQAKDYPDHTE